MPSALEMMRGMNRFDVELGLDGGGTRVRSVSVGTPGDAAGVSEEGLWETPGTEPEGVRPERKEFVRASGGEGDRTDDRGGALDGKAGSCNGAVPLGDKLGTTSVWDSD